jgi:energy-coupling factor transporter ATP-binding protein EcfA2
MGDLEAGLLDWSLNRDDWKRDLLRRLAAGEVMGSNDVRAYADAAEREELSKDAPWYLAFELSDAAEFVPLDATHLTATVQGADPVQIMNVVHVHGANDLADGSTLDFNPVGLTIIAGRNGSGKSGYTRILKQVAVCRASEEILPNAFGATATPKAVVGYHMGSSVSQELTWEAGTERIESPLQRVRVFDARAANVHLAGSTEVAYVPPTLQVLGEYTRLLQQVDAVIDSDLQQLRLQRRDWPNLEAGVGTEIFENNGEDRALEALKNIAPLTKEEEDELAALPARIRDLTASNPAALAVQARQRSGQLTTLARNLEVIAAKVSVEAIADSEKLQSDETAAQVKATEARSRVEADDSLFGTGGDSWQELWNAAKTFIEADHEHRFPDVSDDSSCPLCQQRLDGAARARFARFAEFMSGEAQTALVTARTLRNTDVDALNALPLGSVITQDVVDLVSTYNDDISRTLLPAIAEATLIRNHLVGMDDEESGDNDAAALATTFVTAIEVLREAAATETASAEALAATDTSAVAAAQLQARHEALTIRKGIAAELGAIAGQHDRAIRITRLTTSKGACNTTSASRKNSDLSSNYVEKVCQRFEEEAKQLGIDRVPVELVFDRSSRGVSYIKVSLKDAPQVSVNAVLSEGEQRVTAIAGFFADLTESGDFSTLVFDDPVSSLDQEFRVKVAQRLLKESESRQVLVFTHDFSFVQYLYEEKKLRDLQDTADSKTPAPDITYLHIDRSSDGAGVVTTAEEWRHVSVRERLGRIKQRIQAAGVLFRNNDFTGYGSVARDIVGAIRDTWEAFVEQELLDSAVTRHDRRVQTQRLPKLTDLTDADVATVTLGMTIESRFMTGHAAPLSDGSVAMSPDDLSAEVKRIEDLRKAILDRRR